MITFYLFSVLFSVALNARELFTVEWILIGRQYFYRSSAENRSESDSNDFVPLCRYHCSCGADFCIIIELVLAI